MLAYVFWHWPRPEVGVEEYETALRAFHAAIGQHLPSGMRASRAWRVQGAPWLPAGPAYEDWYLLESTAALDSIAHGAVAGAVGARHDLAAALSAGGIAGLYRPARSPEGDAGGRFALWFSKPTGSIYDALYQQLDAGSLWIRMLTLGPTPELCLLEQEEPTLPSLSDAVRVVRRPVWP